MKVIMSYFQIPQRLIDSSEEYRRAFREGREPEDVPATMSDVIRAMYRDRQKSTEVVNDRRSKLYDDHDGADGTVGGVDTGMIG
jgi:hypothetical protein